MQELVQREQQSSESADDYIHHMRQLASRFQRPMRDRELVRIIKRGLKESLAKYIYAMDIITVDELRQECIEVERNLGRRTRSGYAQQPRFSQGPRHSVHEVEIPPRPPEPPLEDVEEASVRSKIECWNCRQLGHSFRDCLSKERKIFCYRCGKPDTLCPECVNCPGNYHESAMRARQTRSGTATEKKAGVEFRPEEVKKATATASENKLNKLLEYNNYKDKDTFNTSNKDNYLTRRKKLRGLPYKERVRAYMSARNRIFGERQLEGMILMVFTGSPAVWFESPRLIFYFPVFYVG